MFKTIVSSDFEFEDKEIQSISGIEYNPKIKKFENVNLDDHKEKIDNIEKEEIYLYYYWENFLSKYNKENAEMVKNISNKKESPEEIEVDDAEEDEDE